MKVKELIAELSKYEPEDEVTVGGKAIHFVDRLPGYYDGYYEKLIEDEEKRPHYSIKGMEFTRAGTKIVINTFEVDDLIWNCETEEEVDNLEIKLDSSLGGYQKESINRNISQIKSEFKNYLKARKNEN